MQAIRNSVARNVSGFSAQGRRGVKTGLDHRVTAVLGGQWGDEGKGKLSDVLAKNYDIVGRFNGGDNAGHTVVVDGHKFAFHLVPCGIVYPHTQNVLGNGCVVHIPQMFKELEPLKEQGIEWEGRMKISDRAHLLFKFHREIDALGEKALGEANIGTTKKGIGPCYTTKAFRNGIRAGELREWDAFEAHYKQTVAQLENWYGKFEYDTAEELDQYKKYSEQLVADGMIIDSVQYVNQAYMDGKNIITEGANASMLDLDFGTYPFVTSSTTTVGGICTGLGLSPDKIECAMGVVKAYTTRVGWGPFPTELTDSSCGGMFPDGAPGSEIGRHLQITGGEIGVTTKRKRRCGWLDIPVVQYGNLLNGYSNNGSINLTKLDVLDELDEVKLGTHYKIDGVTLGYGQMPANIRDLARVEVVYETMPGWKQSIAHCETFEELPAEAQHYVKRIEELVGADVSWVGVGVGREDMATNGFTV